ncbi:MAG: MlaD family protein [Actinomycetota bacterium]
MDQPIDHPSPPPDPRRNRHAVLGVLALCLVASAFVATWHLLHGGFQGGIPVTARFSAPGVGQQLPIGGDVKVRGVLVGRIHDISLADSGHAVVHMRLDPEVPIPNDARAEIRSKTAFGQKWLELIPSPNSGVSEPLAAGNEIPDERTEEPLEFEKALQLGHDVLDAVPLGDLSAVLRSLAEGFSGQEPDARRALDRGLVALRAVNSRSQELDLSLRQLREFAGWLDDNDAELLALLDSFDRANRALIGAAPEFRSNLLSVPLFFDRFAAFQETTEQDLGRLIQNGATLAEFLAPRSDRITDLIVQLEAFTTVWNSGLKQPCAGEYESNMTCWQIYQMPGMESRGLYGRGQAPDADEPGDPLFGARGEAPDLQEEIRRLLGVPTTPADDLARVLLTPLDGPLP